MDSRRNGLCIFIKWIKLFAVIYHIPIFVVFLWYLCLILSSEYPRKCCIFSSFYTEIFPDKLFSLVFLKVVSPNRLYFEKISIFFHIYFPIFVVFDLYSNVIYGLFVPDNKHFSFYLLSIPLPIASFWYISYLWSFPHICWNWYSHIIHICWKVIEKTIKKGTDAPRKCCKTGESPLDKASFCSFFSQFSFIRFYWCSHLYLLYPQKIPISVVFSLIISFFIWNNYTKYSFFINFWRYEVASINFPIWVVFVYIAFGYTIITTEMGKIIGCCGIKWRNIIFSIFYLSSHQYRWITIKPKSKP